MNAREREARRLVEADVEWFHAIELVPGVSTPGRSDLAHFESELERLDLPDLSGKSVLDIGASDGFFSFAAERLGASRVVALDHYLWFTDLKGYMADRRESQQSGTPLVSPHESRHWRPDEMPGRQAFDMVHEFLGSEVEPVVGDFMTMDLDTLGRFDVILFLGVLYHLESPLEAMRRLHSLATPGDLIVLETEAMAVAGHEDLSLCRFLPDQELNSDPSNWWVPNEPALRGLCTAAGFEHVSMRVPPPAPVSTPAREGVDRIRSVVGAARRQWRDGGTAAAPAGPVHYRAIAHLGV